MALFPSSVSRGLPSERSGWKYLGTNLDERRTSRTNSQFDSRRDDSKETDRKRRSSVGDSLFTSSLPFSRPIPLLLLDLLLLGRRVSPSFGHHLLRHGIPELPRLEVVLRPVDEEGKGGSQLDERRKGEGGGKEEGGRRKGQTNLRGRTCLGTIASTSRSIRSRDSCFRNEA